MHKGLFKYYVTLKIYKTFPSSLRHTPDFTVTLFGHIHVPYVVLMTVGEDSTNDIASVSSYLLYLVLQQLVPLFVSDCRLAYRPLSASLP